MNRPDPQYLPGDPVVLWSASRYPNCPKEYGRVIDSRWHVVLQCWDYYVAFFGSEWPASNKPFKNKPYVLRYLESSLRPYPEKKSKVKFWVYDPNAPGRIVPGTKAEAAKQEARVLAQNRRAKRP